MNIDLTFFKTFFLLTHSGFIKQDPEIDFFESNIMLPTFVSDK